MSNFQCLINLKFIKNKTKKNIFQNFFISKVKNKNNKNESNQSFQSSRGGGSKDSQRVRRRHGERTRRGSEQNKDAHQRYSLQLARPGFDENFPHALFHAQNIPAHICDYIVRVVRV